MGSTHAEEKACFGAGDLSIGIPAYPFLSHEVESALVREQEGVVGRYMIYAG